MQEKEKQLRNILTLNEPGLGNKNYSVVAGAGAGKTTLLSVRISEQIAKGTPIEEFVIITYTNAAATELREKIAYRLKELLKVCEEDKKEQIEEALGNIELMQISTIHSFLLKLLRESAFESKVTLDARLLDGNKQEDELRKKAFFETWYKEHYDEIKTFRKDWRIQNSKGRYIDHTREVFENMFMSMANIREDVILGEESIEEVSAKWADEYIHTWLEILIEYRDAILQDQPLNAKGKPKSMNKGALEIKENVTNVEEAFKKENYGMEEALLLSEALKKADSKSLRLEQKYYRDSQDPTPTINEVSERLYKQMEEDPHWKLSDIKKNYLDYYEASTKLAKYVLQMKEAYQKEIDQNTAELSNDDILYRSEQLLLNHPEVLNKLRKRYSKIYVDEFQDTTLLQTNIVKLLSSLEDSTLEEEKLKEDTLIVVGDPKQSIYRFSGAERSVYDDVNRMMNALPQAEVVELNTNFRSNEDIIHWVNDTFSKTMGSDYNPMETEWVVQNKDALHGLYQYVPKDETYGLEQDVEAVVELVKEFVENEKIFIETRDGKLRRVQYSDIMIITKVTTNMSEYVKALSLAGIPVNVSGKFAIGENEILRNYVLLLSYLANPKDKKKYYIALQVVSGKDVLECSEEDLKKAEEALVSIKEEIEERKLDAYSILEYVMLREELYLPKDHTFKKESVREYRIHLHQMVESCIQDGYGDLQDFVDLMLQYLETNVEREVLLESDENAVRFMNVHKSKGLTAQIVIVADRRSDEKCRFDGFKKAGKYYPAARIQQSPFSQKIIPTYVFDPDIYKMAYKDEMEEKIRLEYVAATRGAHALIFMPVTSSRSTPWFSHPAYGLNQLRDINEWIDDRTIDSMKPSIETKQETLEDKYITMKNLQDSLEVAELDDSNWKKETHPLRILQVVSITPSSLEPNGQVGYDANHKNYIKEERPSANVFGTVLHRCFELLFIRYKTINNQNLEASILEIINQAILENKENFYSSDNPKEYLDYLKPILLQNYETFIKEIMEKAEEVYPEYAFSFYVKEDEVYEFLQEVEPYFNDLPHPIPTNAKMYWVNGTSDLVVKEKDGTIKIYDFKSDMRNGMGVEEFRERLKEKYKGQLALYRYAIRKTFGVKDNQIETELKDLYE